MTFTQSLVRPVGYRPSRTFERTDVFFHISAYPRDVVPEIGQRVSFETGFDRNAKPIAVGIEVVGRFASVGGVA